jgi:hypothetical protein
MQALRAQGHSDPAGPAWGVSPGTDWDFPGNLAKEKLVSDAIRHADASQIRDRITSLEPSWDDRQPFTRLLRAVFWPESTRETIGVMSLTFHICRRDML